MDWKKALKMAVGIPETAKGASALGEIPAGAEETVELPAGELKIAYAENTNPPNDSSGRMVFPKPEGFTVSVSTSAGEPLEVRDPGRVKVGAQMNKIAWRDIADVDNSRGWLLRRLLHPGPTGPQRAAPLPGTEIAPWE